MERETGIEPATSSLGSWRSTAELLPLTGELWNVAIRRTAHTAMDAGGTIRTSNSLPWQTSVLIIATIDATKQCAQHLDSALLHTDRSLALDEAGNNLAYSDLSCSTVWCWSTSAYSDISVKCRRCHCRTRAPLRMVRAKIF